ncbi:hypothetical protein [Spiroplasma endosymbiont of Colias croceus]|uniref:hypothetical protein n=1 Tax=Spiroplasma endosymbiont of Colias croceus TaxID=3066310 RepID=UPI0030CCA328
MFFVVNTSVQAPTSLIASNDPNVVNYDIKKEMIKHVKYNDFNDWATIPWNSAYFDVDQPDLKLVSGEIIGGLDNDLDVQYQSDVVGVKKTTLNTGTGVYSFRRYQLDDISRIMFNHNFIQYGKKNQLLIYNVNHWAKPLSLRFELNFEIDKPLSFYIQGFMFYFSYEGFSTFTGDFAFSFLDYEGNTKYVFKGTVGNDIYMQDLYNFISMPVRVPNLRHLTVFFDIHGTTNLTIPPDVLFGQVNIFSSENITPVPPNSPFNPEYERPSWYDVFGHLRNAFRWVLYGVVGKVLPVEPLRQFVFTTDSLLRHIFSDTISTALNVDIVSGIENIIPLWLFVRAISLIIG